MDLLLFFLLLFVVGGVVAQLYRIDRRAERRRTREALGAGLRAEIEQERLAALARKERFHQALKAAEDQQMPTRKS